MNIAQLLDRAKKAQAIPSDLQLAKRLKLSQATVWKWRKGESLPNIEHAQALAELAGLDPAQVVAEVLIQGAESPALVKTLRRFLAVAIAGLVCILCKIMTPIAQHCPAAGRYSRTSSSPASP